MNKKAKSNNLLVGSMLFGLFFGAGNLIFPINIGQLAGENIVFAAIGFLITASGIPFLGILSIGLTNSKNVIALSGRVSKWYSYLFTILLYLTIGPLFALPRTATVSFEVGLAPIISPVKTRIVLLVFTFIFFALALIFSLKPARILDWVGKFLNPIFLVFLSVLIIKAMLNPMGKALEQAATAKYIVDPLISGFIDGYSTMDALAALAFGGIIVETIKGFGIAEPKEIAKNTSKAGIITVTLMCVIYFALIWLGATSKNVFGLAPNGGIALAEISQYYLGSLGSIFLAITITVACFKTAIGLITACSKIFTELYPQSFSYSVYAVIFSLFSFVVSNLGLDKIIAISLPMLMFLYPLSIALIFLGLLENTFNKSRIVYITTSVGAVIVSVADLLKALPEVISKTPVVSAVLDFYNYLPFFKQGMGWIIPTIIGFVIGIIINKISKRCSNVY